MLENRANLPNPQRIMQLATGYWDSAALLAANELEIFGALANGARTAAQIANAGNLNLRAAAMLLDACAGLGLLTKQSDGAEPTYANTPESGAFLVSGRPGYLGGAIRWGADQYAAWGNLAQAVLQGRPAVSPEQHLGGNPEETRRFVIGMRDRALGVARPLVQFLNFDGATNLLDVGGGPGTYATLLAQKYPNLNATVLDLPPVVAIAEELIAEAGVADRVKTRAGNAVLDDYGDAEFDAILFSGVLHQMSPATIQAMFVKAKRALRSGGQVVVSDVMLQEDKTQPSFAALFSLQMLLTSEEGAVFSGAECKTWLELAGFADAAIRPLPPPLPYTIVQAVAPK